MELDKILSSIKAQGLTEIQTINRVSYFKMYKREDHRNNPIYIPYVPINTLYTRKYITTPQYWAKDGA